MFTSTKEIYRFNAILIKIPMVFFSQKNKTLHFVDVKLRKNYCTFLILSHTVHLQPGVIKTGFPGGSVIENLSAMQGPQEMWFDPWVGKIHWRRAWQPTPVPLPGERSPVGYSPKGCTELDTTEATQHACTVVKIPDLFISCPVPDTMFQNFVLLSQKHLSSKSVSKTCQLCDLSSL